MLFVQILSAEDQHAAGIVQQSVKCWGARMAGLMMSCVTYFWMCYRCTIALVSKLFVQQFVAIQPVASEELLLHPL